MLANLAVRTLLNQLISHRRLYNELSSGNTQRYWLAHGCKSRNSFCLHWFIEFAVTSHFFSCQPFTKMRTQKETTPATQLPVTLQRSINELFIDWENPEVYNEHLLTMLEAAVAFDDGSIDTTDRVNFVYVYRKMSLLVQQLYKFTD